jgi:hypothetical protein
MTHKSINNFKDIEITNNKTLVICDIDNTILFHDVKLDKFVNIIKNDGFNEQEILELARQMMEIHCRIYPPSHTDLEGFKNLKDKVEKLNGKIIFLTARSYISDDFTKKQIQEIGLCYEEYEIHYTDNKISKGNYIKNNITTTIWNDIIFIDDYDFNLDSVKQILPESKCYKFEVILS